MRPDPQKDRPIRRDKYQDRQGAPPAPRELLFTLIQAVAIARGFEILDANLSSGGTLRVVLDRDAEGGIGSEDLTGFIFELRDRIHEAGHDPGDLNIELDSPGATRPLTSARHFERFKGKRVRAFFRVPQDGKDHLVGKLLGADGDRPIVEDQEGGVHTFDPAVVKALHLEP